MKFLNSITRDVWRCEKYPLLQKLQQLPVKHFRCLDMRHVSQAGKQHQLRAGNGIGNVFRQGREVLATRVLPVRITPSGPELE